MADERISDLIPATLPVNSASLIELSLPAGGGSRSAPLSALPLHSEITDVVSVLAATSAVAGVPAIGSGFELVGVGAGGGALGLGVAAGFTGGASLCLEAYQPSITEGYEASVDLFGSRGVAGAPPAVKTGDFIGSVVWMAHIGVPADVGDYRTCAYDYVVMEEDADGTHTGVSRHMQTRATVTESLLDRIVFDSLGHTNIENGVLITEEYTVATLPTASAAVKGGRAHVTDALGPAFLAPVVGGGAVVCPVFCDGAAWVCG